MTEEEFMKRLKEICGAEYHDAYLPDPDHPEQDISITLDGTFSLEQLEKVVSLGTAYGAVQ